jgi:hypothetical protein
MEDVQWFQVLHRVGWSSRSPVAVKSHPYPLWSNFSWVHALLSGSCHNIRVGRKDVSFVFWGFFWFEISIWKYFETIYSIVIVLSIWRSFILIVSKRFFYQVLWRENRGQVDEELWLCSVGMIDSSGEADIMTLSSTSCKYSICTLNDCLSLKGVCIPGYDLAMQSTKLHMHTCWLLPSPLLLAPQPLLCPAGQGH